MPDITSQPLPELISPVQDWSLNDLRDKLQRIGFTVEGKRKVSLTPDGTTGINFDGANKRIRSKNYIAGTSGFTVQPDLIESDNLVARIAGIIGSWLITASGLSSNLTEADAEILLDKVNTLIRLGPTSGAYITLDGANQRIRTSNYVTGVSGGNFDSDLIEAQNIRARGVLQSAVFQKDIISAIGGLLMVANADVLDADMTAADNSTLTIKGDTTLAVNDIIRLKDGTDDEWLRITNIASAPIYTVTRDLAAAYASGSNPAWKKGQAVVKHGSSDGVSTYSGGWLQLFGEGTNSPYYSVFKRTGVAYNAYTEIVRIGNLNGFLDYVSDEYGIAMGDSTDYVKIDQTNGVDISGYKINTIGGFGGDGSDGALAISSGTTTINLGSANLVVKNYTSISITGTGKLAFSNPADTGTIVILKSRGNVVITSSTVPAIDLTGMGAAGGVAAIGGGASTAAKTGFSILDSSDHFGLVGTASSGDSGGTGGAAGAVYTNKEFYLTPDVKRLYRRFMIVACGSGGGAGGQGSFAAGEHPGGDGGNGGGGLIVECNGDLNFTGTINVDGAVGLNGANGDPNNGGGGGAAGGSAGMGLILYKTLTSQAGTINARGGAGGNGGNGGAGTTGTSGGAGGGGGSPGSYTRAGHAGGTGGSETGGGGNGTNATDSEGASGAGGGGSDSSPGGTGGAQGASDSNHYLIAQNIVFG